MTSLHDYLLQIRQAIVAGVRVEQYREQILTTTRANLRIRLRLADNSLLEISEALVAEEYTLTWLSYRYHYQDAFGVLVFRYDNAPHHPEIVTHPDHKHRGEQILASGHLSIEQLLEEVQTIREPVS